MFAYQQQVAVTLPALTAGVPITPQTAEAAAPYLFGSTVLGATVNNDLPTYSAIPLYMHVRTQCTPAARGSEVPERGIGLPAGPYDAAAGFDFRFERNGCIMIQQSGTNSSKAYIDLITGLYPIGIYNASSPFFIKAFKYSGAVAPAADTTTEVTITITSNPCTCTRQPTVTGYRSLAAAAAYTADVPYPANSFDVWANVDLGAANPPILRARCGTATALRDYSNQVFLPPWSPVDLCSTVGATDFTQLQVSNAGLATADTFFRFTLAL